jgi:hypothetical protein
MAPRGGGRARRGRTRHLRHGHAGVAVGLVVGHDRHHQPGLLGLEPAPEREKRRTWKQFMKAHWDSLCGCDFFAVEALGLAETLRYRAFFVMALKTRAVEIAGIRALPPAVDLDMPSPVAQTISCITRSP